MQHPTLPATSPSRSPSPSRSLRICGLLLALCATGTSAWICVVAGNERGGQPVERFAWAAVGLVLLFGAHLLPALTRSNGWTVRGPALALWLVCMVSTGYGHATFFLTAQQHAGDARADSVQTAAPIIVAPATEGRSLDAIANDIAHATQALAIADTEHCSVHCDRLAVRRKSLTADLAKLNTEAGEARRREQFADRAIAAREQLQVREDLARTDPVTARLSVLLHVPRAALDLGIALAFGWLVECLACIGWLLALAQSGTGRHSGGIAVTARHDVPADGSVTDVTVDALRGEHANSVTGRNVADEVSNVPVTGEPQASRDSFLDSAPNAELLRLAVAITEGRARPTVRSIRDFMQPCSQEKASRLRREFLELAGRTSAEKQIDLELPPAVAARPRLVHPVAGHSQAA